MERTGNGRQFDQQSRSLQLSLYIQWHSLRNTPDRNRADRFSLLKWSDDRRELAQDRLPRGGTVRSDFITGGARYLYRGRKRVVREFTNRKGLCVLTILAAAMLVFLLLFLFVLPVEH